MADILDQFGRRIAVIRDNGGEVFLAMLAADGAKTPSLTFLLSGDAAYNFAGALKESAERVLERTSLEHCARETC